MHLYVLSPWSPSICDTCSIYLIFYALYTFDEDESVIVQNVFQFGFVWCSLMIRLRLCIWREYYRNGVSFSYIILEHALQYLLGFSTVKLLFFPVSVIHILEKLLEVYANILFVLKLLATDVTVTSIRRSCPQENYCSICMKVISYFSFSFYMYSLESLQKLEFFSLPTTYLFNYSFISVRTHGYWFYSMDTIQ